MKLTVKHFPKHRRSHKISDKNSIKLSYSCMKNIGNVITKHNNKLISQSVEQPTRMSYCRDKPSCPMEGNCLQKCFVYQAQVDSPNSRKYYLGTNLKSGITILSCYSQIQVIKRKLKFQNMFYELKDKGEDFTIK